MQVQYIRIILLINNFVSSIISFATAGNRGGLSGPTYALGGVLAASWVMNLMALAYASLLIKVPPRNEYISLTDTGRYTRFKPGVSTFLLLALMDSVFGIVLAILTVIGYIGAWRPAEAMACTGGLVATVIHLFFVVAAFHTRYFKHYKLRLVLVNISEECDDYTIDIDADAALMTKEQSAPVQSSVPIPAPQQSNTSPYRGSPSTKPSQGATLYTDGPIKLIEPTETDALVEDHD